MLGHSFQWRHFGAEYRTAKDEYTGQGVDQLAEVIDKIKNNPTDRRIILSAWNPAGTLTARSATIRRQRLTSVPADLAKMALPPCHMFCQFYVNLPPPDSPPATKPRLSCLMYQRSADLGLGVPFNIASYALLTHMIALVTDTVPHEFILQLGDAHVYLDHVEPLQTQLERTPFAFPEFAWKRSRAEIGDIDGFEASDFVIDARYKENSHGPIAMKMSV